MKFLLSLNCCLPGLLERQLLDGCADLMVELLYRWIHLT